MDSETISRDPSVRMTESNVPPGSFGSFPVLVEEFLNEQVIVEYREGVPVFMFSVSSRGSGQGRRARCGRRFVSFDHAADYDSRL